MKNKIIFKTLMLKGEAGSTIVSMEKTGHVGTADIYTITFNDGSTTEISLEGMSAITSVEKTSSTDTEDIYTITCADGSTQTFSVLNHNADIAAMSDDIDVMDARLDNFFATQTGVSNGTLRTETTLFSSTVPSFGNVSTDLGYFNLSDSVDDYDEILIRYNAFGKTGMVTMKPEDFSIAGETGNRFHWSEIEPNSDIIGLENSRTVIRTMVFVASKFSDVDRLSIDAIVWGWNGDASSNGVVSTSFVSSLSWDSTSGAWKSSAFTGGIYSVVGIKYEDAGTDKDPELADLRVDINGVTHNSAGAAVRAQIAGLDDRVDDIEAGGGTGGGLTAEAKAAILACFRGVVWRGDVDADSLYSALDTAFNPPADLSSITAVYTQSGAVDLYDSLESLRSDLVVTAHYADNTSVVVTSYTLSGTLTLGTSTITVSYGGKTTTFNVTVTSEWDYVWDLTNSLTDTVSGVTAVASAGTGVDAPAITSAGLVYNAATQRLSLGDISLDGKTIEIDVASFVFKGSTDAHMRFLMWNSNSGAMIYHKTNGWGAYGLPLTGNTTGWSSQGWGSTSELKKDRTIINGTTVKIVFESENWNLYINNELYGTITDRRVGTGTFDLSVGGTSGYSQSAGDQCYDMTISAIRIKTNPTGGNS